MTIVVTPETKQRMRLVNQMWLASIALGILVIFLIWPTMKTVWAGLQSPNEIVQLRFMWWVLFMYVNGLAAVALWFYHFRIRNN